MSVGEKFLEDCKNLLVDVSEFIAVWRAWIS